MRLRQPLLIAALMLPAPLTAQFDDPKAKIAEMADKVAAELREIDRLLLQTGDKENVSEAMAGTSELLKQTTESQQTAVQGIDELIKAIEDLANNSRSDGHSDGEQRKQPKPGNPQQRSQRQESKTPDRVQNQEPQGDRPKGDQHRVEPGQNAPDSDQSEGPTERADKEPVCEKWGSLPDYLQSLKTRGSRPEVPEKYRKLRDAFLKESQRQEK